MDAKIILIDNGHGAETKGKQSPDGLLREYSWTRRIAVRIVAKLKELGYNAALLTPENEDVPLSTRVRRVNAECDKYGKANVLCVSVHVNASGNGSWAAPNGWSVYVAPNASANSKKLAQSLYSEAEQLKLQGNRYVPKDKFWVGNFAIIRDTKCPAVLTENMFMDNKKDCEYLLSEIGQSQIVELHVRGIIKYLTGKCCNCF